MKNKTIKTMIWMILLLVAIQAASASICTVSGYITDPSGNPVPDGTKVAVKNLNTLISYPAATGGNWPYPNYYSVSFTCAIGVDEVVVTVQEHELRVSIQSTETNADMQLSAAAVQETDTEGQASEGGQTAMSGSGQEIIAETPEQTETSDEPQKEIFKEYIMGGNFAGELYIVDVLKGEEIEFGKEDVVLFYIGDISSEIKSYILKLNSLSSYANLSIQEYRGETNSILLKEGIKKTVEIAGYNIQTTYQKLSNEKIALTLKLNYKEGITGGTAIVESSLMPEKIEKWLIYIFILLLIILAVLIFRPVERAIIGGENR